MRLDGNVAIVTGGSRGIGRAIAVGFAREGANVAVAYHSAEDKALEAVKEIEGFGRKGMAIRCDVKVKKEVDAMVEKVVATFGRLDIMVNNAGSNKTTPFLELTEEEWDEIIDTDLKGCFLGTQAAARVMVKQGYGRIINIGSARKWQVWPGNVPYCSAKGGVASFTRVTGMELAKHGIVVTAISPGTIETDINRWKWKDPEFLKKRLERMPVGRLGQPEEIVGAAVLLASKEASFMSGADIIIDGGQTLW